MPRSAVQPEGKEDLLVDFQVGFTYFWFCFSRQHFCVALAGLELAL